MNRRRAILTGLLVGGTGLSFLSFSEWFKYTHSPNLSAFQSHGDLMAELVECIIPQTDTPGAKEAGVHLFVIKAVNDCCSPQNQRNFLDGLANLKAFTKDNFQKNFIQCSHDEKEATLKYFEAERRSLHPFLKKVEKKLMGDTFFNLLRRFTITGYCTSLLGATKGMNYDYIPSTYQACIPVFKNQRAWATK